MINPVYIEPRELLRLMLVAQQAHDANMKAPIARTDEDVSAMDTFEEEFGPQLAISLLNAVHYLQETMRDHSYS